MKQRIKLAISRILTLQAEFTPSELKLAISLIKKMEIDNFLKLEDPSPEKNGSRNSRENKASDNIINQGTIRSIEGIEPEKFSALSNLIDELNNKKLFLKLDEIRNFALAIDKNFKTGKTARETLPKFISLLQNLPIEDLNRTIKEIRERSKNELKIDDSYQNLAQFLIKGE